MKRLNRLLALVALVATVAVGVTFASGLVDGEEAEAASNARFTNFFCNPAGTWVGNDVGGDPTAVPLTYTEQFSPIDLRTLNYRMEFKNVNVTWGHPALAETDTWIGMEGTARLASSRRGDDDDDDDGPPRRKYDVSAIGYGIKDIEGERGQIQHITTMIGSMWLDGCNTKSAETVLRVYDYTADEDGDGVPDVDKNLDGIPDEDAVPIISAPPPDAPIDGIPFPASKRVRLGLPN